MMVAEGSTRRCDHLSGGVEDGRAGAVQLRDILETIAALPGRRALREHLQRCAVESAAAAVVRADVQTPHSQSWDREQVLSQHEFLLLGAGDAVGRKLTGFELQRELVGRGRRDLARRAADENRCCRLTAHPDVRLLADVQAALRTDQEPVVDGADEAAGKGCQLRKVDHERHPSFVPGMPVIGHASSADKTLVAKQQTRCDYFDIADDKQEVECQTQLVDGADGIRSGLISMAREASERIRDCQRQMDDVIAEGTTGFFDTSLEVVKEFGDPEFFDDAVSNGFVMDHRRRLAEIVIAVERMVAAEVEGGSVTVEPVVEAKEVETHADVHMNQVLSSFFEGEGYSGFEMDLTDAGTEVVVYVTACSKWNKARADRLRMKVLGVLPMAPASELNCFLIRGARDEG